MVQILLYTGADVDPHLRTILEMTWTGFHGIWY